MTTTRLVIFAIALIAILVPVLNACRGTTLGVSGGVTQGTNGAPAWTVAVNLGITAAKDAIPVAQAALAAIPSIPPATLVAINRAFTGATEALGIAAQAMQDYATAPTIPNQCRAHSGIDDAVTLALQGIGLVRDVGVTVDPLVLAAVGALGTVADMLYPTCAPAPTAGAPVVTHVAASQRIRSALAPR